MLSTELNIEYIVVVNYGYHAFSNKEEINCWLENMVNQGFIKDKDFKIYKKI